MSADPAEGEFLDYSRIFLGSAALARTACARLVASLGTDTSKLPPDDLRPLLTWVGEYIATGAETALFAIDTTWPAHALTVIRPCFELSHRLLWATRTDSRRKAYLGGYLYEERGRLAKRYGATHKSILAIEAEAVSLNLEIKRPLDMESILREVAEDDIADVEYFKLNPDPDGIRETAKVQYTHLVKSRMHPSAHGDYSLFRYGTPTSPKVDTTVKIATSSMAYLATIYARSCHIVAGMSQVPCFWAYQWVTRGKRCATEPDISPFSSYGDLGLPAL